MTNKAWLTDIRTGRQHGLAPLLRSPETGNELSVTFDLAAAAEGFATRWKTMGSMWDRFGAV
ncbi:MAG TPA: hypothetical protein VL101_07885, partial [Nordella sp.]|nr:hypothetical protein [Nordella sp.]